jgi:predicted nucleic acid-binding protein
VKFLLDTNVVSEFIKTKRNPGVYAWLDKTDELQLAVSVISLGEVQNGISRLSEGKRKVALQDWLDNELIPRFDNRILSVTLEDMLLWGKLTGKAMTNGETLPTADVMLAAVARNNGLMVITRNEKDFARMGVSVLNPWNSN